jgi:malonyl-CoA O-methyltransferase
VDGFASQASKGEFVTDSVEAGTMARFVGEVHPASGASASRRVPPLEGYELWAPTYDREPNPLLALEERALDAMLPPVQGRIVLDAACGTGRWLEKLLHRGARHAVGVDYSAGMLARANQKMGLRGRMVRADVLSLPIQSRVVDVAICSLAAGYLDDLDCFAGEVARVLRYDGRLFLTDAHPEGLKRGWRRSFRLNGDALEIEVQTRPVAEVRAAFERYGFELLQTRECNFGEPERPIFARAGRSHFFEEASSIPALYLCEFRRAAADEGKRTG